MNRHMLTLSLLLVGLVLAPALHALESSTGAAPQADTTAASSSQGKNNSFLTNLQNTVNGYKTTIDHILACHAQTKFWAGGTSCSDPDPTHISIAADIVQNPPISITGNTPNCSTSCHDEGNWWSGSHIVCTASCICTCPAGTTNTTASIRGTTVTIQPRSCAATSVPAVTYSNPVPYGLDPTANVCRASQPGCPAGWVTAAQYQAVVNSWMAGHPGSVPYGSTNVIDSMYGYKACYQYAAGGQYQVTGSGGEAGYWVMGPGGANLGGIGCPGDSSCTPYCYSTGGESGTTVCNYYPPYVTQQAFF